MATLIVFTVAIRTTDPRPSIVQETVEQLIHLNFNDEDVTYIKWSEHEI